MTKMTKTQIQERQCAIWTKIDEMDEMKAREQREFTSEEAIQYDALVRESGRASSFVR